MPTADYIVPTCHEQVRITYNDDALIIVEKPSGLLSVPGRHPANRDCVISRIQQTHPSARIVHRLDMDTSGIMVLAVTANSHRALSRQFEQRQVHKRYEALVFGAVSQQQGAIDVPLCSDWPNRPKQKVDFKHGKAAFTYYEVLSKGNELPVTRLQLSPVTGRSHQLRVHLAHIGHPILGCSFYAHSEAQRLSDRLLLHATYLRLNHPVNGVPMEFSSNAPF